MIFKKIFQAIKHRFHKSRKKQARRPRKRISKKSRPPKKKNRVSRKPLKKKQKRPPAPAPKKPAPRPKPAEKEGKLVGEVTHFFSRIKVCVVKITAGKIAVGDQLRIKGRTASFVQKVQSLQIENNDVPWAGKGKLVGLKVDKKARPGSRVLKI